MVPPTGDRSNKTSVKDTGHTNVRMGKSSTDSSRIIKATAMGFTHTLVELHIMESTEMIEDMDMDS